LRLLLRSHLPPVLVVLALSVATTASTSPLMSFTHVPHAVVARDLMDADEVHTFSESSRNTLIATAAVGKSFQLCSFAFARQYEVSPTSTQYLESSQIIPLCMHTCRRRLLTEPQAVHSSLRFSYMLSTSAAEALRTHRSYMFPRNHQAHRNSHQRQ